MSVTTGCGPLLLTGNDRNLFPSRTDQASSSEAPVSVALVHPLPRSPLWLFENGARTNPRSRYRRALRERWRSRAADRKLLLAAGVIANFKVITSGGSGRPARTART